MVYIWSRVRKMLPIWSGFVQLKAVVLIVMEVVHNAQI